MGYYGSYYCYMALGTYKDMLDELKAKIQKNYTDMDLSNASVQADIEKIVGEMTRKCDAIKNDISGTWFE